MIFLIHRSDWNVKVIKQWFYTKSIQTFMSHEYHSPYAEYCQRVLFFAGGEFTCTQHVYAYQRHK